MLDDLRTQANSLTFFEEEEVPIYEELPPISRRQILGMSAFQRFVLSAMFLFIVMLVGSLGLLVTGRIVP